MRRSLGWVAIAAPVATQAGNSLSTAAMIAPAVTSPSTAISPAVPTISELLELTEPSREKSSQGNKWFHDISLERVDVFLAIEEVSLIGSFLYLF